MNEHVTHEDNKILENFYTINWIKYLVIFKHYKIIKTIL